MGLISNSAFSRSWMIRLTESFSHRDLPFAAELVEEKVVAAIRTAQCLRFNGVRFTLDAMQRKSNMINIHSSHLLGYGMTIQLLKVSEYETSINVLICDLQMERMKDLENEFIEEVKNLLYR